MRYFKAEHTGIPFSVEDEDEAEALLNDGLVEVDVHDYRDHLVDQELAARMGWPSHE